MTSPRPVYQIRLPSFEGPLDLLLQLVERRRLDISAVSLAMVTEQYLEHLASLDPLDLDAWSGFLVIAARLLLLKSRALLPLPQSPTDQETAADSASDLVQQLEEYRRLRPAIAFLRAREDAGLRSYPRLAPAPKPARPQLQPGAPLDVLNAYRRALARREPPPIVVQPAAVSIVEQVERIRQALRAGQPVVFTDLLAPSPDRAHAVASFLAVLELIQAGAIVVDQATLFGEIVLRPADHADWAGEQAPDS